MMTKKKISTVAISCGIRNQREVLSNQENE